MRENKRQGRNKGAKQGTRKKGAKQGTRNKGAKQRTRNKGAKKGTRNKGAKQGIRNKGAKQGTRKKGAKQGTTNKGANQGRRSKTGRQGGWRSQWASFKKNARNQADDTSRKCKKRRGNKSQRGRSKLFANGKKVNNNWKHQQGSKKEPRRNEKGERHFRRGERAKNLRFTTKVHRQKKQQLQKKSIKEQERFWRKKCPLKRKSLKGANQRRTCRRQGKKSVSSRKSRQGGDVS